MAASVSLGFTDGNNKCHNIDNVNIGGLHLKSVLCIFVVNLWLLSNRYSTSVHNDSLFCMKQVNILNCCDVVLPTTVKSGKTTTD